MVASIYWKIAPSFGFDVIGFKSQLCLLLANYFISLFPHLHNGVHNECLYRVVGEIKWDKAPDTVGVLK